MCFTVGEFAYPAPPGNGAPTRPPSPFTLMNHVIAALIGMSKYKPPPRVICYVEIYHGLNGWVDIWCNIFEPGFRPRKSIYKQMCSALTCVRAAAFWWAGTHGSMDGLYFPKMSTRPVADLYENTSPPGARVTGIKSLTF